MSYGVNHAGDHLELYNAHQDHVTIAKYPETTENNILLNRLAYVANHYNWATFEAQALVPKYMVGIKPYEETD